MVEEYHATLPHRAGSIASRERLRLDGSLTSWKQNVRGNANLWGYVFRNYNI